MLAVVSQQIFIFMYSSQSLLTRPAIGDRRAHPSEIRNIRTLYQVLGPCCNCPLKDEQAPDFVEAAVYMPSSGPYAGQYVAACAKDNCGYLGEYTKLHKLNCAIA